MADTKDMRRPKSTAVEKTRTVTKVKVNGTEKRYRPSRHYVYILQVRWSDYSEYVIYRKYSDFYTMQCAILEKFPIEAGTIRPTDRVIPYLPGRLLFSRTEVSKVANQRRDDLAEYCRTLLQLDEKISACTEVLDFFEARPEDINPPKDVTKKPERSRLLIALLPFLKRYKDNDECEKELSISDPFTLETYVAITDYEATEKSEVSLKEGMNVEVFEKNSNGWWFVQTETSQGWAPASYLDPVSHPMEIDEPDPTYTGDLEKYITTQEYTAQMSDEITFEKDVIVEVMHKLLDGWWIVSYRGEAGYAPAAFLTPYYNPHMVRSVSVRKPSVKPIPRRCTLKKASTKCADRSRRDLSLYRKYSKKRKVEQAKFNAAPPPPKPPRIIEEEERCSATFENEAFPNTPEEAAAEEPEYLEMERDGNAVYENITDSLPMNRHPPRSHQGEVDLDLRKSDLPYDLDLRKSDLPYDLDPPALRTSIQTQSSVCSDCASIPDGDPDFYLPSIKNYLINSNYDSQSAQSSQSYQSSSSGYDSVGSTGTSVFQEPEAILEEEIVNGTQVTRL